VGQDCILPKQVSNLPHDTYCQARPKDLFRHKNVRRPVMFRFQCQVSLLGERAFCEFCDSLWQIFVADSEWPQEDTEYAKIQS